MARKVFFSFHFANDFARTQQVRNMNILEGNSTVTANNWETIKQSGDAAVKKWIDDNMHGKSCVVVLVGSNTAERKWVKYEIKKAWEAKKGVLAIHVNKLKDLNGNTSVKGANPFDSVEITQDGKLYTIGNAGYIKTPAGTNSKETYATIADNIDSWIEEAIENRKKYK
jgi:hypothetical protein